MKTEQETKSKKDAIAVCTILTIAGFIFLISSDVMASNWRIACIFFLTFCYIAGLIGNTRKIGFGASFFISFLLTPLIGLIVTFNSPRINDEEYKEKMLDAAENKAPSASVADQLHKLNELRKDGVLTDEEFARQKEKLLNS